MIPRLDKDTFFDKISRKKTKSKEKQQYLQAAASIIDDIQENGDQAVHKYIEKFDGKVPESLLVTEEDRKNAWNQVDDQIIESLQKAAENIRSFHEKQLQNSRMMQTDNDIISGQLYRSIERVGIYVPGGTAVYPSSVLMNAIPASLAGVDEIIMATPVRNGEEIAPILIVAADISGVTTMYRFGGVQAIASLAYGTETIEAVDKIVGPGNAYVAAAKQLVFGDVGIDMIAGPSEVAIVADETADPTFVAADLIAQAEHDVNSPAYFITTSERLLTKVQEELSSQCQQLPREAIATRALTDKSAALVVDTIDEGFEVANQLAPEHLEIQVSEPFARLSQVRHAGSVFVGSYTPEALGDYYAGPNHVLPTSGTARFSSGLSVDDFMKKTTFLYYSESALEEASNHVMTIANEEHLEGHGIAVKKRLEAKRNEKSK
ncbi:histidinol dehydrogenase [Gracilibacillus halophilus YIM-C55.5]|uniref:Histidinol dehydrogenase n=1 Tax=Gracilibacillus halophilus YIM-C55.5 TaxID=1308866 RepID=N4WRF2_9BACI|nr:histidinol dehydrogenase [Gracilibacillus halophilus]ENH96985.1 histidinol dehydrogenase [Gracilibacillus halophilus YIM-C55.5]